MNQTGYSYFQGDYVPQNEAKINILTHAFNYGTACFEGIRGYWNEEHEQLYIFRLREHFQRMTGSVRILRFTLPGSVDELCNITTELARRNAYRQDIYMRPTCYLSSEVVGVRLHGLDCGFCIYCVPFGSYIDTHRGLKVGVSSWKRVDDNMIPARAKISGSYVNSAFAKTEALLNGFDEAIMLTNEGNVSEGSAENLFMLVGDKLITPPVVENVLVGITRDTIMKMVKQEFGMEVVEREIDRTELYTCDELLMCGTGAQVASVAEVDHRPVGNGQIGALTAKIQALYSDVVHGKVEKYKEWCTPVY